MTEREIELIRAIVRSELERHDARQREASVSVVVSPVRAAIPQRAPARA